MPVLSDSSRAALSQELEQCPPVTLRLVLRDMCDQNADVAQALHRALCVDVRPSPPPTTSINDVIDLTEGPDSDTENAVAASRKRTAPEEFSNVAKKIKSVGTMAQTNVSWKERYVHCVNCYELFDVVENEQEKNEGIACLLGSSGGAGGDENDGGNGPADTASSDSNPELGNCIYHDGHLDVDYDDDFWADHDECHGDIDSMELRNKFPEGYTWDCCNQRGDVDGCKSEWHQTGSVFKYYAQLQKAR